MNACACAKGVHMTTQISNTRTSTKTRKSGRKQYSVYFAGDLWTHKDLVGNAILADYIKKVSRGRYRCVLPQDLEEPVHRTVDIRNVDLKHVLTSDMAIFNFDGANLDSGTVVEFIYAKMLDVPCVLLRTDFRASGEGNPEQDPWNLMASHWPRTRVLRLHGMADYQSAKTTDELRRTIEKWYAKMAGQVIESLDSVRGDRPLASPERVSMLFDWALEFPGAGYNRLFTSTEVQELIARKTAKGLLS